MTSNSAATNEESYQPLSWYHDGDIVLQSSGNVQLQVHKSFLRQASPFFCDMFNLPQTPNDPVQTIKMTEDAKTLDILLRYIYPVEQLVPDTLDETIKVYEAATKLQMDWMKQRLNETFTTHISKIENPVRAWAIAKRYTQTAAYRAAVRRFIEVPDLDKIVVPGIDELQFVSVGEYFDLLLARQRAISNAKNIIHTIGRPEGWESHTDPRTGVRYHSKVPYQSTAHPFLGSTIFEFVSKLAIECPICRTGQFDIFNSLRGRVSAVLDKTSLYDEI